MSVDSSCAGSWLLPFAFPGRVPAVLAGAAPLAHIRAGTWEQAARVGVLHSSWIQMNAKSVPW